MVINNSAFRFQARWTRFRTRPRTCLWAIRTTRRDWKLPSWGLAFEVLSDALLAVSGAVVPVSVNNQPQAMWTSFRVERGDVINIRATSKGVRAYVAVAGGFVVPRVMGSCSTYTAGRFGGLDGRPLAKGDTLHSGSAEALNRIVSLPEDFRPQFHTEITLRALPGPQDDYFDAGLNVLLVPSSRLLRKQTAWVTALKDRRLS